MHFQSKLIIASEKSVEKIIEEQSLVLLGTDSPTSHPDYLEVSEPDKNTIGISYIKIISQFVYVKPYQANHKLVVIKSSEKLTPQAQNALLKILEEPPVQTQIILFAQSDRTFLDTIISRCIIIKIDEAEVFSNEFINAKSFIEGDIFTRFELVDELAKSATPSIKQIQTEIFLKSLIGYLKTNFKLIQIKDRIEIINNTYKNLRKNGNYKLIMDNLVVNL